MSARYSWIIMLIWGRHWHSARTGDTRHANVDNMNSASSKNITLQLFQFNWLAHLFTLLHNCFDFLMQIWPALGGIQHHYVSETKIATKNDNVQSSRNQWSRWIWGELENLGPLRLLQLGPHRLLHPVERFFRFRRSCWAVLGAFWRQIVSVLLVLHATWPNSAIYSSISIGESPYRV